MEYYEENLARQRGLERMILTLFTCYFINMSMRMFREEWEYWIPVTTICMVIYAWVILIRQYKSFQVRSTITTIIISIVMLIYGIHTQAFMNSLTTFYVLSIMIALYGIAEYIHLNTFVAIVLFLNYGLNVSEGKFDISVWADIAVQLTNVIVMELLLYIWVRNRTRNMMQTVKTIETLKLVERSKDDFLANVSHEFRTPLNTILGMSEMALQETNIANVRDEIYNIRAASRNLMAIVSDILDFSELQAGDVQLEVEAYNIASTMNDIINMSTALKADKDIELIVNFDANMPSVLLGDEKKLRRVIMNLVSNAIKFTKGGCVCIDIKSRKESYGVNLCITVMDTGIGMTDESMEKLFTSFGQIDTRRNRQNAGIGLGLAITKTIVEKMGGTILVKSELGKGTIMQVVVPQKVADERPVVSLNNSEQLSILIYVNMEQFNMAEIRDAYTQNIEKMVEQVAIKSHVCRNLNELKRRIERESYSHIVITDVEYQEEPEYFDKLAQTMKLLVILDREDDFTIQNQQLYKIYKPFYIMPIISVLSDTAQAPIIDDKERKQSFIAPEANILVVDDNLMNIKVLEGLLKKYQIQVTRAISGAEALEKIELQKYDFVFMDHMMPEMDGVETAHRIRNKVGTYYQSVPIIALTANAVAGTREMFLAEGFADFVVKPVEMSVLERVIKRNIPSEKIVHYAPNEMLYSADREDVNVELSQADNLKWYDGLEGIDTSSGILYCGGADSYKAILQDLCEQAYDTREELNMLFQSKNWKDYTIKVHAMKSSLKTIGALELAQAAYALELAGKENNIAKIYEEHQTLMDLHAHFFQYLTFHKDISQGLSEEAIFRNLNNKVQVMDIDKEALEDAEMLSEATFEELIAKSEQAVYSLDKITMLAVVDELERYQYNGFMLEKELRTVRKKINQEDYFSAQDHLIEVYKKLTGKEGDSLCI